MGDDFFNESENEGNNTQNKSVNTEKKKVDKKKQLRERRNKIEEFMLFDIDKNNSTANKENQRLLQSFDIAQIALAIIKKRVDRITNYNEYYVELIRSCYRFLVAYVRNNF